MGRTSRLLFSASLAFFAALPAAAWAAAASTVTTLALSPASVTTPGAVTLTATVSGAGPPVTGTVTFCDAAAKYCEDSAIVGMAQLNPNTATAKLTFIPAGSDSYYAVFSGTATEIGSTSNIVASPGLYPTTMTLAAPPGATGYDLTATVTGLALQQPLMTGSVNFQDLTYGKALGTAALSTPSIFAQSFLQTPAVSTGPSPADAAVADFNEDGIPDLAVVNAGQNAVSILIGKGDGTFQLPTTLPSLSPSPQTLPCASENATNNCSIAVGDFEGKGHADLAVTIGYDDSVNILLGNGDGTFKPSTKIPTMGSFPEAVRVGDFDNDGVLDLAIANAGDGTNPGTVSFLKGKGDGTFAPFPGSPLTVGVFPFFLAVGFFNADNFADVAVVNEGDGTVTILLGNGQGQFNPQQAIPVGSGLGSGPGPIVAAHFNGDTNVDLAVATYDDGEINILAGNGNGQFSQQQSILVSPNPNPDPFGLVALDYNGDGYLDLAVSNYRGYETNGTLTLLKGGKGGFTLDGTEIPLGALPNDVVSGDFNGDGEPDLAVPESGSTTTTILLNHATQTATAVLPNVVLLGAGPHTVQASYPAPPGNTGFGPSSAEIVLQGLDVPTTLTLTSNLAEQMITMPVTFTAQLSPTASIAPTGTITFYDQSGGGAQLGSAHIGANGQVLLTVSFTAAGVHSITASYSGDPFFPASNSNAVSVTIDDLSIVRVGNNNTTIVPGTTVAYTLQVMPQVANTFLYTVSFRPSDLPAGATYTFSPATLAPGSKTANITMTVATAAAALSVPSPYQRLPLAMGFLLPLIGAATVRRRMGKIPPLLGVALLAALSLAATTSLSGCSGAGLFAARKVSYSISVIATEGTVQRSTQVPLGIQ